MKDAKPPAFGGQGHSLEDERGDAKPSGPKMVACATCGQTVTKRSTLSVGNGKRACRSHGETREKSTEKLAREERGREAAKEHRERECARRKPIELSTKPICCICTEKGVTQRDFFFELMKEMKKSEIQLGRPINFFNANDMRGAAEKMKGRRCLYFIPCNDENKKILRQHIHRDLEAVLDIVGVAMVCPDCVHNLGLHLPEVTPEQFKRMLPVTEILKPFITKIAKTELARDQ